MLPPNTALLAGQEPKTKAFRREMLTKINSVKQEVADLANELHDGRQGLYGSQDLWAAQEAIEAAWRDFAYAAERIEEKLK